MHCNTVTQNKNRKRLSQLSVGPVLKLGTADLVHVKKIVDEVTYQIRKVPEYFCPIRSHFNAYIGL